MRRPELVNDVIAEFCMGDSDIFCVFIICFYEQSILGSILLWSFAANDKEYAKRSDNQGYVGSDKFKHGLLGSVFDYGQK